MGKKLKFTIEEGENDDQMGLASKPQGPGHAARSHFAVDERRDAKFARPGASLAEIAWPAALIPVRMIGKSKSHAQGGTWLLRNDKADTEAELTKRRTDVGSKISEAETTLSKIERTLQTHYKLEREAAEEQEEDTEHLSIPRSLVQGAVRGLQREESEEEGRVLSNKEMNILEREFDRRQVNLQQLREQMAVIDNGLAGLGSSWLEFDWKGELPDALKPFRSPWTTKTSKWAKPNPQEEQNKKDARGQEAGPESKDRIDRTKQLEYYVAKLFMPQPVVTGSGKRMFSMVDSRSERPLQDIKYDAESLEKAIWAAIVNKKGQFSSIPWHAGGLLPILHCESLKCSPSGESGAEEHHLAIIQPYCDNQSLDDILSYISGEREEHWFASDLIYENLNNIIEGMSYLERARFPHFNIKPANIFVDREGTHLLLGDFVPKCDGFRFLSSLGAGSAFLPEHFCAPEIYSEVYLGQKADIAWIQRNINVHKADVFCLGLSFYCLLLRYRTPPEGCYRNERVLQTMIDEISVGGFPTGKTCSGCPTSQI